MTNVRANPRYAPSVSVVIPTYNRAHFLAAALQSVRAQTVPVGEIIVIDDGSTDNTAQVVAACGSDIKYVRQENAGPAAARNLGVRRANGDFIAFQDSDDLWVPEKTALQLDFLARSPTTDVVFGLMANVWDSASDADPEIRDPIVYNALREGNGPVRDMFSILVRDNVVPTPTVMVRCACLEHVGGFDPTLRVAEDFDLWLRLSTFAHFGFVDRVLLKRRRHEGNLINERATRISNRLRVLERLETRFPDRAHPHRATLGSQISALHYDLGSLLLRKGKAQLALAHFERCASPESRLLRFAIKRLTATLMCRLEAVLPSKTTGLRHGHQ